MDVFGIIYTVTPVYNVGMTGEYETLILCKVKHSISQLQHNFQNVCLEFASLVSLFGEIR